MIFLHPRCSACSFSSLRFWFSPRRRSFRCARPRDEISCASGQAAKITRPKPFAAFGWKFPVGICPNAPTLIASRHKSTFDILVWLAMLPTASFVVKKELSQIPLFGHCIRAAEMICIERKAGGAAMRELLRGADRARASGRNIIIFPEGTRAAHGRQLPLQPGIIALAARTGLPVVPVMTNSGKCWGSRSFYRFLER